MNRRSHKASGGESNTGSPEASRGPSQREPREWGNRFKYGHGERNSPSPCGGLLNPICCKLELAKNFKRPMDPEHHIRLQAGILEVPSANRQAKRHAAQCRKGQSIVKGIGVTGSKSSHNTSPRRQRKLLQLNVSGPTVRRIMASSHRPPISQQVCCGTPFQNGIHQDSEARAYYRRETG